MSQSDWTVFTDSLSASSIKRGVTSGITPPTGGGTFIYGFNSLVTAEGAVGLYATPQGQSDFAPTLKGGRISGAIQKGSSAGSTDFCPWFAVGAGASVLDSAYLVGFTNENPARLALRKGPPAEGVPAAALGAQGILRRSSDTFAVGTWIQLRVDWIVNANGDVILQIRKNSVADVTATASWVTIAGLSDFVDDYLEVNSGSAPIITGRIGYGLWSKAVQRRAYFDYLAVAIQI